MYSNSRNAAKVKFSAALNWCLGLKQAVNRIKITLLLVTRVPNNMYPVCTEHALQSTATYSNTTLQLMGFCTAHACLPRVMEAKPEILLYIYIYKLIITA